jgi:hypothetical protein
MRTRAFVVGMSDYPNNVLDNPVNDANSIEIAFTRLSIDSIKKVNVGIAELKDSLDQFKLDLQNYEASIFFFAGHGLQIKGENYLCAIDTDFDTESRIQFSSLSLTYLINLLEQTNVYTKIIILDACRDNPFERNFRTIGQSSLAPVYAPLGTLIAFATSPGQKASDGHNGNGAYTYALLKDIFTNDLKIEELFKRVRNTLYTVTSKKQLSWEHTSLMGDFYFSTSTLTGTYSSNYSSFAFSDSLFNYSQTTEIVGLINALHSYNWNLQNPAIRQVSRLNVNTVNIDELFVLGRNIYQAGVGPAWDVQSYLENLHSNLSVFPSEIQFHILNGIVYEIYFNNQGILRDEFKVGKIDVVYGLLFGKEYKESLMFIKSKLRQYDFRVIYNPLSNENLILNVMCSQYNTDLYRITEINMNGINILYKYDGTILLEPSDDIFMNSIEEFKELLIRKIGVPSYKLSVYFNGLPEGIDRICIPIQFKLLTRPIRM